MNNFEMKDRKESLVALFSSFVWGLSSDKNQHLIEEQ